MFKSLNPFKSSSKGNLKRDEKIKIILKQAHDFELALRAMDYVLDDRAEEGLALLNESEAKDGPDQTINVLARGVIEFLEATLSFEPAEMKKASNTLSRSEQLSLKSRQRAQNENLRSSGVYPPGTVYSVTYTESLLLHALLMLFSESMMEAAKAVLKLRKAYYTLQDILVEVKNYDEKRKRAKQLKNKHLNSPYLNDGNASSSASFISANGEPFVSVDIPYELTPEEQRDKELLEYAERVHRMRAKRLTGSHINNPPPINRLRGKLGLQRIRSLSVEGSESASDVGNTSATEDSNNATPTSATAERSTNATDIDDAEEISIFHYEDVDASQATIDEFIHSGVNLCFGILQVVLSMLPPAVTAVLSAIGFRGSREEGLRLVWKATRQRNVHGNIGLLGLLFYYDGPFQFTDDDFDIPVSANQQLHGKGTPRRSASKSVTSTKSDSASGTTASVTGGVSNLSIRDDTNGSGTGAGADTGSSVDVSEMDTPTLLHPGKVLEDALLKSRSLFPNSALWLLNEARILCSKGKLREAVQLMDSIDMNKIHMRQVKVLLMFDRAVTLVHLHEFDRAAEDFIALVDISDWSHALYTYFAGSCYLENYRMCQMGLMDSSKTEYYREKAEKLIFSAPFYLNKKGLKTKVLPLDKFMLRKVDQFGQMEKLLGVKNPLDAIGTSPVHELAYFYNGYNRMSREDLELTKKLLTEYKNPAIEAMEPNQEYIKNLLLALTMRRLGDVEAGCKLMDEEVIPQIITFEKNGKFKYIKKKEDPWAYPAALYERALFAWKLKGMDGLAESKDWLLKAQGYSDDYELSTRIGMKIKAALNRVDHSL